MYVVQNGDLQLNVLESLCCTVAPVFSNAHKASLWRALPWAGSSLPQCWELGRSVGGQQLGRGSVPCAVDDEVSPARPAFTRTLCPPQQVNIRNPTLQMGKQGAQRVNLFLQPIRAEEVFTFNFNKHAYASLQFRGWDLNRRTWAGKCHFMVTAASKSGGWISWPPCLFPKPFRILLSQPDWWPAQPPAVFSMTTWKQVPSVTGTLELTTRHP